MENSVESASPSRPTPATNRRRRIITSCDTCRRRKVKCDRQHPVCAPCQTAGRVCLYKESSTRQRDSIDQMSPLPIRNHSHGVRRHARNSPDLNTIDARLGRLERLLEQAVQTTRVQNDELQGAVNEGPNEGVLASPDVLPQPTSPKNELRAVNGDDGTLLVEDGKSHFVSSQHWALLATEIRDIRDMISTDKVSPFPNQQYLSTCDIPQFLPSDVDMCCDLLQVFYENVDPIISLVHKPTLDRRFASFVGGYVIEVLMEQQDSTKSTERELEETGLTNFRALAFSIFFAAITSLSSGAVASRYGEEKTHLLATYRKGLELSLVAAGFCDSSSIEVLQAFVLFLSCQMRDESMGRTWPLLGVAIRVAKSQGLHSEPTLFSPVPNEVSVELRRRIWHQIFYLECRAAEVKGYRASLTDDSFSTAFPRNVNDVDLVETRPPRDLVDGAEAFQFTDMSCQLCRFRMFKSTRQIMQKVEVLNRKIRMTSPQAMDQRIADFNRIFRETKQLLDYVRAQNDRHFSAPNTVISPIEKLTRMIARSMEWKSWLSFWCGIPKEFAEKVMSNDARRTILQESITLLESLGAIGADPDLEGLRWFIEAHSAFQTIMVVLSELRGPHFTSEADSDLRSRAIKALRRCLSLHEASESRAWAVIEKYIDQVEPTNRNSTGDVVQPSVQEPDDFEAIASRLFPASDASNELMVIPGAGWVHPADSDSWAERIAQELVRTGFNGFNMF